MPDRERGQATPLLLVVLLLAALSAAGMVRIGVAASDRAGAQAAADAAALAGGLGDRAAAAAVAEANDAVLVAYDLDGDEVQVVIERDGLEAKARSRWFTVPIP
jgi:hypothetical protein